jgi:hypothetical protein
VRDDSCVWISDGRTVHTGLSLAYRSTPGVGGYARAELTGDGGTVLTNPFGFGPIEGHSSLSAGSRVIPA